MDCASGALSANRCQSTPVGGASSAGADGLSRSTRESVEPVSDKANRAPDNSNTFPAKATLERRGIGYGILIQEATVGNEVNKQQNNHLGNKANANGNQGTIVNSGNTVGKLNKCNIMIETRGFTDGILETRGRVHSNASDHKEHMKFCKCNCANKPPKPPKPKKRSLPDQAPTEAISVPLLLEPTCSVLQGFSGQHYFTGSCSKSTLAGRRITSILPSA